MKPSIIHLPLSLTLGVTLHTANHTQLLLKSQLVLSLPFSLVCHLLSHCLTFFTFFSFKNKQIQACIQTSEAAHTSLSVLYIFLYLQAKLKPAQTSSTFTSKQVLWQTGGKKNEYSSIAKHTTEPGKTKRRRCSCVYGFVFMCTCGTCGPCCLCSLFSGYRKLCHAHTRLATLTSNNCSSTLPHCD